jgi:hypothetical protein
MFFYPITHTLPLPKLLPEPYKTDQTGTEKEHGGEFGDWV